MSDMIVGAMVLSAHDVTASLNVPTGQEAGYRASPSTMMAGYEAGYDKTENYNSRRDINERGSLRIRVLYFGEAAGGALISGGFLQGRKNIHEVSRSAPLVGIREGGLYVSTDGHIYCYLARTREQRDGE